MKTERYENDQGDFSCFGFPNTLIGKEGVRELLLSLPEVKIKYLDKSWGMDVFCEFTYKGQSFFVSEPYGDNSYYDIVCEKPNTPELEEIYNLFSSAKVPSSRQVKKAIMFLAFIIILFGSIYAIK